MGKLSYVLHRPFFRRTLWLVFSALFFYSGLYFTEWVLEPDIFAGGPLRWALVALFPLMVPLFFFVNGRFGCAGGSCGMDTKAGHRAHSNIMRMPGA
jgi:hypothetical protein